MTLTIRQLMQMHDAMEMAIKIFDQHPSFGTTVWHELIKAKATVRVAIEQTGAEVKIKEAA